jgi:hypothetical protein
VTHILESHYDPEVNPDNNRLEKERTGIIEDLFLANKFTKNYGPKCLISDFRYRDVPEHNIPTS